MDAYLGNEIGRGGFGTVYVKSDDPGLCIKVSHKNKGINASSACRQWSDEFKKITTMMKNIRASKNVNLVSLDKFQHVKIIEPVSFIGTDDACYMVLPRIYRPEGRDVFKPTLQAQFGAATCNAIFKGRGEFIGLKELKQYLPGLPEATEKKALLHSIAHELGLMMGMIHFVGKNDGNDIELFMGKEAKSKKVRFYIADFDLSNNIDAYDTETIERMRWSMDAVPYFPRADVDEKMFTVFKAAYASVANNNELVERIFEGYG